MRDWNWRECGQRIGGRNRRIVRGGGQSGDGEGYGVLDGRIL